MFVNVPTSSTLWRDAPCGPLLGVRLFDSDDDAVACVNGPVFATAATVVAADADRGAAVARRLRADSVTTSDGGGAYLCEYPAVPRGGRACSWVCRKCWEDDHGLEGMYRFMETRAMDWSESRLRPHGEDSDRSDDGGVYKDYD